LVQRERERERDTEKRRVCAPLRMMSNDESRGEMVEVNVWRTRRH
jgi:hypothetical protein